MYAKGGAETFPVYVYVGIGGKLVASICGQRILERGCWLSVKKSSSVDI